MNYAPVQGSGSLLRALLNSKANSANRKWDAIARRAGAMGLAGLLLDECQQRGTEIPTLSRDQLRSHAVSTACVHIEIERQLPAIVGALVDAGVQPMLLKGAALTRSIYSRPELRPMSDVDILVRETDALRALRALERAGCRHGAPLVRDDFFPRFHYETELFTNAPLPVRIDLHCRPFRPVPLSRWFTEADWWSGAHKKSVGPFAAYLPSSEVMLIHLAAHAAFHGFTRTLWLFDIHRWLDAHSSDIDWDRFCHLCMKWRLALAVRMALAEVDSVFGCRVPGDVRTRLDSFPVGFRDRWIFSQAPRDAARPIRHVITNLLCTPGLRYRISYLAAHLRPHAGHLGGFYSMRHVGWTFVAHTIRLGRQFRRFIRAIGRRLTARKAAVACAHIGGSSA